MKILLIGGIAFVVIGLALLGTYWFLSTRQVYDRDGMVYVPDPADTSVPAVTSLTITKSGDSLGCFYEWTAELTGPDSVRVTVVSQPTHNDREKTTTKTVGLEVLQEISAIVQDRGMTAWDDLPDTDLIALDAASTGVSFVYRGAEHGFSSSQELPEGGWAACWQIRDLIEAAAGVSKK